MPRGITSPLIPNLALGQDSNNLWRHILANIYFGTASGRHLGLRQAQPRQVSDKELRL